MVEINVCECGFIATNSNLQKHKNTVKHVNWTTNTNHLNEDQLKIIRAPLENGKILGCPGSAKTTTLLYKIVFNNNAGVFVNSRSFLILTFSRCTVSDVINKGSNINSKLFNNTNVKTFHSLAGSIKYKFSINTTDKTLIYLINEYVKSKECTPEILKLIPMFKTIKCIFVDEAQDLNNEQYDLAVSISSLLNIPLILLGDANQNIYQFQMSSDKYLQQHPGSTYFLTKNYRSVPEIIDIANCHRPIKNLPDIVSTKESSNNKPTLIIDNKINIRQNLINYLNEIKTKNNFSSIAIISPIKKSKNDSNFGICEIANILHSENFPICEHYKISANEGYVINVQKKDTTNKINLYTVHGVKGLEYDTVILFNYHYWCQSFCPSQKELLEYKNLFYVALTRAKYNMIVYCIQRSQIWIDFSNTQHLWKITGNPIYPKIKHSDPMICCNFSVTKFIQKLTSTDHVNLKKIFDNKLSVNITKLYSDNNELQKKVDIFDKIESDVCGIWCEKVFEHVLSLHHSKKSDIIEKFNDFIMKCVEINNSEFYLHYKEFTHKNSINYTQRWYKDTIMNEYNFVNSHDEKKRESQKRFHTFLKNNLGNNNYIYLCLATNDVSIFDRILFQKICKDIQLRTEVNHLKDFNQIAVDIFTITMCYYQIENEAKRMWIKHVDENFYQKEIDVLSQYIPYIIQIATKLDNTFLPMQYHATHTLIPFTGILDVYSPKHKTIIELKFVESIDDSHRYQTLFYHQLVDVNNLFDYSLQIWNIRTNVCEILQLKPFNRFDLLNFFIDKMNSINNIDDSDRDNPCYICLTNPVYLYDLETTGLDVQKCKITQVHVVEYSTGIIIYSSFVNPNEIISEFIVKLTGITNEMVKNAPNENDVLLELVSIFRNSKYAYAIAHNGNRFDHQILKYKTYDEMFKGCTTADSMTLIKNQYIRNQKCKTSILPGKLTSLYKIVTGKDPIVAHRADADVTMMCEIFKNLNMTREDIVRLHHNAVHK